MGNTRPTFIPGLQLSERFYREAVRPILETAFPGLQHAAALIGSGSEVLGFDDPTSSDHHWGPRVLIFLRPQDHARLADSLTALLADRLPLEFAGFPTNFSAPDPADHGVQLLQPVQTGPVNHRVEMWTLRSFVADVLAFDLEGPLGVADWLTFPEQSLRSLTAGAVYHDEIGLEALRARLAYYPHDVWLYRLAAGWARIGQEEHLMGRAGLVGDELGSALIAARLVRDAMCLLFLMERTYAPYAKWFGTAFRRLACADRFEPDLRAVLTAKRWREREEPLVRVYEALAARHNALGLTEPLPAQVRPFFGRPLQVIALHGFAEALLRQVRDPEVHHLAARPPIGAIDQFSDSTDLVTAALWRPVLRRLYE